MKLKKLSAIFLSVIMLMALTVPFSTVSAAAPNLQVYATTDKYDADSSNEKALPMTITINNNATTPITVISIDVGGGFSGSKTLSLTIQGKSFEKAEVFTTFLGGKSNSADIKITIAGNTTPYEGNATVSTVTPYIPLGGSGDGGGGGGSVGGGGDGTVVADVDPKPYVFSMDTTVFKAGDTVPVSMRISTMDGYADNVRMKLSGPEGAEEMFSFYTQTGWLSLGDMTKVLTLTPYVQINPAVADGTYAITVTFDYSRNGKSYVNTSKLNFIVKGKSTEVPYLKAANFSKAEIGKDNKSTLVVNVANGSSSDFYDVNISFNSAGSKGFSLYETTRSIPLNTINPHTSKAASFPVYVDSATATGNYPMAFDISYKDYSGAVITSVETIYVQVNRSAEAEGEGSTPRIIVSEYSVDTETIKAGQSFELTFSLKNTSLTTAVNNIKVVLGSAATTGTGQNATGGDVFFPAQGSNSFFIQSIGTGAVATNKIKLMARQDVEPGVYPIYLDLAYEDSNAKALASKEQISFSVTQEQRLDIQELSAPTDAMMGSPIPVSFKYINKGKSSISNLSVGVDGDFTIENGNQYIGTIAAGYNDYFEIVLLTDKEGSLKGDIIFTSEDSNGNENEKRIPITCNVAGGMDIGGDIPGMNPGIEPMPMPEQKGGLLNTILWIGIPALVVIVGVLALVIILKKRKAKKELVEDEED